MQKKVLKSRVALIPGGVKGIGRALCVTLARQGWTVAACYRKSETDAAALESELQTIGVQNLVLRADVSRPAEAEDLVRRVEDTCGRIDALVNCVGSYHRIHLLQESIEDWHAMFDNNLHPAFYLSRAAAPGMIQRGWGRIINFSMVQARTQSWRIANELWALDGDALKARIDEVDHSVARLAEFII